MSQTTAYDVANRTVSVTDFNGKTTVSQYDQQGRVISTTFADGVTMRYTYTASGQIETVTDSHGPSTSLRTGVTRYSYTGDGQLQSVTDANGATVSYGYDELGRKKSVTAPSGTTEYEYNTFGQLTGVTAPDKSITRYTYDEFGNRASMISPNGITTTYRYDTLNRLIGVDTRNLTNALLASYAYTLNAKGQRTRVVEGAGGPATRTIEYTYDAADRLIAEQITDPALGNRAITYTYDPVGNRLEKTDCTDAQPCVSTAYEYDANDRLLTETPLLGGVGGGLTYTYDNNGNLLTKRGNGENWQLTYNALNQVTQATIARPGGTTTAAYAYDHDGIRIGKTINGTEVITYIVDKNRPYAQVIEERHTHPNPSQDGNISYVYGDALIAAATAGATQYYHADGMGSMRGLSDAAGNITDSYAYDAYGMVLHQTGAAANPYLYRGEQYDADLSAYYLRARYYQPDTGRFLTTDSVEGHVSEPPSLQRYMYAYCDPIHYIDPSGKISFNEMLVTAKIVGELSAGLSGTTALLSANEKIGTQLAELFPDAGVIGFSIGLQLKLFQLYLNRIKISDYIEKTTGFFRMLNQPITNWTTPLNGGVEILFSLSSAQIGIYRYWTTLKNFELGYGTFDRNNPSGADFIDIPVSYYHGGVWNLWNAKNYEGAFVSDSIGIGKNFGMTLFQSPGKLYNNPFGVAFPFASLSATTFKPQFTCGFAATYYSRNLIGKQNYESMYSVAALWTVAEMAVLAISANSAIQSPTGLFSSAIAVSWPFTIARLKSVWNNHYHDKYSVTHRQTLQVERPDDFYSTPIKQPIIYGMY